MKLGVALIQVVMWAWVGIQDGFNVPAAILIILKVGRCCVGVRDGEASGREWEKVGSARVARVVVQFLHNI